MSKRKEFTKKTKDAAYERDLGRCLTCKSSVLRTEAEFDHRVPCGLGGDNSLENCELTCKPCHSIKTHKSDRPNIRRAQRLEKKHTGERPKPKRPLQSKGFQRGVKQKIPTRPFRKGM